MERLRAAGVRVIVAEHGWLPQAETVYFDTRGVGVESTLMDWRFAPPTPAEYRQVGRFCARYRQRFGAGVPPAGLPDDFVLLPLQLETDKNVTRFSPVRRMQVLVDLVAEAIRRPIVVKPHPRDPHPALEAPRGVTVVPADAPLGPLIAASQAVVTINSTVGLEAFCWGKPVVTLGAAFYGGRGLSLAVPRLRKLAQVARWIGPAAFDPARRVSFLAMCLARQWHRTDLENPNRVLRLLSAHEAPGALCPHGPDRGRNRATVQMETTR